MNYQIDDDKVFITLDRGEQINKSFEKFALSNHIASAWINGIGAIENPEIGFFSVEKKSYFKKEFMGHYELLSLIGNITLKDKEPFSHTHITFSDTNHNVFGGHLFDASITAAGEFLMIPGKKKIYRKMSYHIGLPLWCLENKFD